MEGLGEGEEGQTHISFVNFFTYIVSIVFIKAYGRTQVGLRLCRFRLGHQHRKLLPRQKHIAHIEEQIEIETYIMYIHTYIKQIKRKRKSIYRPELFVPE